MKFFAACLFLICCLPVCKETAAESNRRSPFPFKGISHELAGGGQISLTLDHERIQGKITNGPIRVDVSHWTWPFWDIKKETDFGGSWKLHLEFFDDNPKYGQLITMKIDPNSPNSWEQVHISLYTRDKTVPMKCKVGLKEACGIDFTAAPLDLKRLINSMAVDGEIVFTDLGIEKVGQRIRGTYWGTDKKYFTVKGDFDLKVVKVEKR